MNTSTIVQKLWNYCYGPGCGQRRTRSPAREYVGTREKPRLTLRDDGMSYGDYVEQLTYLLFLKMADERTKAPYNQKKPGAGAVRLAESRVEKMNEHPDFLRSPENACSPDIRNEAFVRITEDGPRPKTIEDQHRAVVGLALHDGVPEAIRIQFETTKNLYLYAWFVYRFYPVAQGHAYGCLELALRERFEPETLAAGEKKQKHGPGFRRLLQYAVDKGFLKNEGFEAWRHQAWANAKMRMLHEDLEAMNRVGLDRMEFDESKIEIKDVDRRHDYLAILLKTMPYLRNHYAHGSKLLHNQVLGTLRIVSEIINQVYVSAQPK